MRRRRRVNRRPNFIRIVPQGFRIARIAHDPLGRRRPRSVQHRRRVNRSRNFVRNEPRGFRIARAPQNAVPLVKSDFTKKAGRLGHSISFSFSSLLPEPCTVCEPTDFVAANNAVKIQIMN